MMLLGLTSMHALVVSRAREAQKIRCSTCVYYVAFSVYVVQREQHLTGYPLNER